MARDLSGSSQYFSLSAAPALPITMACWVRPDNVTSEHWFMAVSDFSGGNDFHYLNNRPTSGNVAAFSRQDGQSGVGSEAAALSTGVWQHVAGVWASTASRIAYKDGAAGTEDTNTRNPPLTGTRLGTGLSSSISLTYDGRMAEAAIWDVALGADEIAALAAGAPPRLIRPASLWGYWPLVGGDSPEPDLSGNLRNMTITGSPALVDHAPVSYNIPRRGFLQRG